MAITQGNTSLIDRKTRQMMTSLPVNTSAWSFFVTDINEVDNLWLFVSSATVHYLYHHDEDSWVQIPSGALAGTFGAGACGARHRWSNTVTANGGSTTTATTTANINGLAKGKTIRILTGSQAGQQATIDDVLVLPWGTSTITFSPALPWAISNTDTFQVACGRFYILNAGTLAVGSFRQYDPLTGVWTTLANTGLPATWGTDWKMVITATGEVMSSWTATWATSTTLTCATKTYTADNWRNFQVRITSGTGIWQVRTITANTATQLTVATWTITPDVTSTFEISPNEDFIYLFGNNAVTTYRYSISSNTWTTMAPTTARGGNAVAGMSANFCGKTWDSLFDNESNCMAGRYIYSFRGSSATLDRFDIAGGTAWAGAWAVITYHWATETFSSWSSYWLHGHYLYIKKDATNRYFKYSITGNYIEPLSTLWYTDGAAVIWDKMWLHSYEESGTEKLLRLYNLRNTGSELHRVMIF
mgnify:FL=1